MCLIKSSSQNTLLLECPWPLSRPVALKQLHISGCTTLSPFLFCLQWYCLLKVVDRHRSGESLGASVVYPVCLRFFFLLRNWMVMRFTLRSGRNREIPTGDYGRIPGCLSKSSLLTSCLMFQDL